MDPIGSEGNPVSEVTGPYHDFWVLPIAGCSPHTDAYRAFLGWDDAPLRIADDLLHHELGALMTVPCLSPGRWGSREIVGVNLYGPSAILEDGAAVLETICENAIGKFSGMSGMVVLQWGAWALSDEHGEPMTEYKPKLVRVRAEQVAKQLRELYAMAKRVQSDPSVYLLHLGV